MERSDGRARLTGCNVDVLHELFDLINSAFADSFGQKRSVTLCEGYITKECRKAPVRHNETSRIFSQSQLIYIDLLMSNVLFAAHERKRRSGSVKDVLPENVPVDIVEHRIPEEERICEECGTVMQEIGKEVRRTLQIIPAQVRIREDWYYTYACQTGKNEAEHTPVVKAAKEPAVIPGSFASPEAIAQIMTQKFVMGSPLYRQEQELERMGVHLSRQTMSGRILRAAQDWLKPVYECLHRELVQRQVLHADETTLQVLHEPGKSAHTDSYMWLYRTSGDTDRHIVLYEYQPNRKADHPKEFLKDFSGYLHTDGYKGYHVLPEEIRVVGCWAHARRYFDEALKVLPAAQRNASQAHKG